jgi:hypothetical protein
MTFRVESRADGTMLVTVVEWQGQSSDDTPKCGGLLERLALATWTQNTLNAAARKRKKR